MTDTPAYRIIREAVGGERRVLLRTACATCGGRITPLHSNSIIYKHADPWSPCDGPIFEPHKAVPPAHRPRLLDLCCKAGGAGEGYARAGFEVHGIDIEPQRHYPFSFTQGDILDLDPQWIADNYDAVHASPPCQSYLNLGGVNRAQGRTYEHPDLIAPTRSLLEASGLPWVIENVPDAAPELRDPVRVCGTSFGLPLRRHRLFESNVPIQGTPCEHQRFTVARYWTGWRPKGEHRLSTVVQVYGNAGGRSEWPAAMGIDWMTSAEMIEAIPPAYTEHIGRQLLAGVTGEVAA